MQDLADRRLVGESQNVVEVLCRILGIAPGVRAADRGDSAFRSEQVAQRVCKLRGLGERADEDEVNVLRQLFDQILKTGIGHERDVVSLLFAPDCNDLRHYGGEISIHDPREERSSRALGNEVDDSYTEFSSHRRLPRRGTTGWLLMSLCLSLKYRIASIEWQAPIR